jgi:hypothetical protein
MIRVVINCIVVVLLGELLELEFVWCIRVCLGISLAYGREESICTCCKCDFRMGGWRA